MDQSELRWLAPGMTQDLPMIQQVFKQYVPPKFVIEFTAGKEWSQHKILSLHRSGSACDIRTGTLPDGDLGGISAHVTTVLQRALDARFGRGRYKTVLFLSALLFSQLAFTVPAAAQNAPRPDAWNM